MDPSTLPGMPAPFWFVQFFKVVGFVLHMIPMGIWFAGLPVAIGCAIWNCKHSRRFARRLFGQLPIFMALGINFGIVPLLFLQTTYYKSFYTATILMGWHWLAVIPILIVGYYALYLAAFARRREEDAGRNGRMILFGVVASLCLIAIGVLMTNGLTLMVRSDLWPGIMERTGYDGAATGLADNLRDPAVWLRLATMFALGLMTTGVWTAFDSHCLMKNSGENAPYRLWTIEFANLLMFFGFLLLQSVGFYLTWGNPGDSITTAYPARLFHATVQLELLAWAFLALAAVRTWIWRKPAGPLPYLGVAVHVLGLALFGIMRQVGQNAGVAPYVDVARLPEAVQWSPLIAFLVVFVLGLVVIGWMIRQCILEQIPDP